MAQNKQKKNKKTLRSYLSKYKLPITLYVVFYLLVAVSNVLVTVFFAEVITEATVGNYDSATVYMLIIVGLVIATRFLLWASWRLYAKYSNIIIAELNQDLARQAFKLNSSSYDSHGTGDFVQRIVNEPQQVIWLLEDIVDKVYDATIAVGVFTYVCVLNIYITPFLLLICAIAFTLEVWNGKLREKKGREVAKYGDKINSLTTEIVKSEKDIKSLGLEKELSVLSAENYTNYRDKRRKMRNISDNFVVARNTVVEVGGVLILLLGVFLMDKALLTLAAFTILFANRYAVYDLTFAFGLICMCVVDVKLRCERIFSLFDEEEFVTEKFGNKVVENVKGEIEFKNVGYTFYEYEFERGNKKNNYQTGKTLKSENKIFEDLSFKIQPNTTVAFVGKSGSGKSTIVNLISKMYESQSGQVLIDGVDIKDFSKESLRNAISLVNQFPYIFDMTIKDNLLLAKNGATDEEIDSALARSSLKEFVDNLPNGVNTRVGEGGIKLSGGQRQRLAIARALLRSSPITIFDESTSSLDNYAQNEIKKSIDEMKGQSTVIVVAHRLSTIKNVDKIFFLEDGKIVDEGTFDELFENNLRFKTMFLVENI